MFLDEAPLQEQLFDLLAESASFDTAVSALSEAAFRLAGQRDSEEWTSLVEALRGLNESPAESEQPTWNIS